MKINRLIPPLLGVPIGYLPSGKPVYPVFGGSEDLDLEPDEEGGDEEPDEENEDPDEPDEPSGKKGKYTPPAESEWLKTRNALAKANASAKARREALAAKEKELADLRAAAAKREADDERRRLIEERLAAAEGAEPKGKRGRTKAGGGVPAALVDLPDGVMTKAQVKQATQAAEKAAEERAAERYRTMVAGASARAALVAEGVSKEAVNRVAKLLDLDEIEIDSDTGEITGGLDEQLETLKAELPQLFKQAEPESPKPRRRPAPRVTPAPQPEVETRPLSSAERMAAAVLGNR